MANDADGTASHPRGDDDGRPADGVPVRDIARAALIVSLPAAIALAIAAALAHLSPGAALFAWSISAIVSIPLVHRHYTRLARLKRLLLDRADDLTSARTGSTGQSAAEDEDAVSAIAGGVGETAELAGAANRFLKAARSRLASLEAFSAQRAVIIDSIPDPLLQIDDTGRIVAANPAAREEFGQRILGRDLATVIRHPGILAAATDTLAGRPGRDVEWTVSEPLERVFNVRVEALPAELFGQPSGLLLFNDLTGLRRLESMRVDFVANVSHELRTPLTTLHGFIETLRGPARGDIEAADNFLAIMATQSTRMTHLVEDLLSLSRIEAKEHSAPTGRIALARVVEGVVATADLEARRKGMTIVVELEADLPPVLGDGDELSQVAQNLIENAIKYGRPDTEITITAAVTDTPPPAFPDHDGGAVAFAVRDRGEGIRREHIPRLTERFYRVDTARSRELGGTGLGLAIVKHIVARHRGALVVESTVGVGSRFVVYLPIAPKIHSDPMRG